MRRASLSFLRNSLVGREKGGRLKREKEKERGRMDLIKLEAGPGRMRSSGVAQVISDPSEKLCATNLRVDTGYG